MKTQSAKNVLDKFLFPCYSYYEKALRQAGKSDMKEKISKSAKNAKNAVEIGAALKKGGRFNSIAFYNHFFETVDVWIYNAGIQAKTRHSYECTDKRNILQFVTDGEGTLECGGKSYHLSKDTLFLLPKDVHVKYYAQKGNPYRYYWVAFSGVYADILLSQSGFSPDSPVKTVSSPVVKRSFKRIYEFLKQSQTQNGTDCSLQPKILAAFYDIFGVLLENRSAERSISPNDLINRAVDFMNNEYPDGISVTDVCARLFLNRTYFSVLFKKHMNVSPGEYLSALRCSEACKLLKQTSLSVQAVAESVGMTPNAFFKLFKTRLKMTPSQYRNENNTLYFVSKS